MRIQNRSRKKKDSTKRFNLLSEIIIKPRVTQINRKWFCWMSRKYNADNRNLRNTSKSEKK